MKKVANALQKAEDAIMIVGFVTMVLCIFVQVLNRNFIKSPGLAWTEELAMYAQIYMVMVGTEIGLRDDTQIRITAVVDKLHGRTRFIVENLAKTVVVIFTGLMFSHSLKLIMNQIKLGQTTPLLKLPMWFPYMALVVGFGAMVLVQGLGLIKNIKRLITNNPPFVEEETAEQEA